jgi:hypothetical protein
MDRNVMFDYTSFPFQIQAFFGVFYKKNYPVHILPELYGIYTVYRTYTRYTINAQNNPFSAVKRAGLLCSTSRINGGAGHILKFAPRGAGRGRCCVCLEKWHPRTARFLGKGFQVFFECGFKEPALLSVYTTYIIYTVYIKR